MKGPDAKGAKLISHTTHTLMTSGIHGILTSLK